MAECWRQSATAGDTPLVPTTIWAGTEDGPRQPHARRPVASARAARTTAMERRTGSGWNALMRGAGQGERCAPVGGADGRGGGGDWR